MLEQKNENKSVIEDSNDIEKKSVAQNEEIMVADGNEECTICEEIKVTKTIKPNFVDTFKANLIDLVVIGGISAVGVFVADALLKLAGYSITQKFQMSFIIFMVIMVFYMSIMESGKTSNTIGKKVAGLIITKG